MRPIYKFISIALICLLIYLPSITNFFSADDWYHFRTSNIDSVNEFLNFFSFSKNEQSTSFYRPLPTQVFFLVFQKTFAFNPIPYHVFVLSCFIYSLYLINKLAILVLNSDRKAWIAVSIYGVSVSNFTRLYFLSAFQEVALVIFALLSILSHLNNQRLKSSLFFVLALLSKETAVVIPVIILVLDWSQRKINLKKIIPIILILLPYLYLRFFRFGLAVGDTYFWDFSPIKTANTLMWYGLWSVGAPEFLVDYIGSGLQPIPRFFTDFPTWWPLVLGLLLINLGLISDLFVRRIKIIDCKMICFGALFIISLLPVLFLPQHKFALELGLPLVWFALGISMLLRENSKLSHLFLLSYFVLNLSMNFLTYSRHYAVGRAKISQKVFEYVSRNYPQKPKDSYFEFINDTADYGMTWGSSKQIANTIGHSELFRVVFQDPKYLVYYQDFQSERPINKKKVPLSTKMFLQ